MLRLALLLSLLLTVTLSAQNQAKDIPLSVYLEFARSSADNTWENMDDIIRKWREKIDPESIWGYRGPGSLLEMATIYAYLFELEGNKEYASRAKKVLMIYGDFKEEYPEEAARKRPDYSDGVPPLSDFFTVMRFIRPFDILNKSSMLSKSEFDKAENIIEESLKYLLRTPEWGAMNRAALRGETLAWAVRSLPDNPNVGLWKTHRDALAFDNWGNWEIEDATIYHAVWLYSLLGLADAQEKLDDLFRTPEMYYYAQYFLNLMAPFGMIPDFGDANFNSNWTRYLVFFEAAAKAYNNPELKWCANRIVNKYMDWEKDNVWLAYLLLDCYRYGTDDLKPEKPTVLSAEVMEDMVGKKIVFRNGWEPKSTYLLLNYRDEGDGGLIYRDYLRDAIPVEEEKMTHGHQDENSIPLYMYNGSILLHDAGYRDIMPSGMYGAYRADYFHNRMCIRPEKIWMGQKKGEYRYSPEDHPEIEAQKVLDFLHNAGSYIRVRTQKVDFLTFDDFDYSRTRVIDDKMGYQWDRALVYVKDPEMIIVFDIIKASQEGYLTGCNLWHTRKVLNSGEHWYETAYDSISNKKLNDDNRLLIYFPKNHYKFESVENIKRHYQDETMIAEYTGQYFEPGHFITFATVLVPHNKGVKAEGILKNIRYIESSAPGKGMSIEIKAGERTINVGVKSDLRMDMVRDFRRPRYTYESGKLRFGNFESNGDFFYTEKNKEELSFTIVNLSKAIYNDIILFDQKSGFFGLAFDGSSDQSGKGKARYWRDRVKLGKEK